MATREYRIERDSMGEVRVPKSAYYGAQTQRTLENFPISGVAFPDLHPFSANRSSKSRRMSSAAM
jgi:fumarate hydratase class II